MQEITPISFSDFYQKFGYTENDIILTYKRYILFLTANGWFLENIDRLKSFSIADAQREICINSPFDLKVSKFIAEQIKQQCPKS